MTYSEVKKAFEERGYILLEDAYKNATTKMKYVCSKHPDVVQEINWNKFSSGTGCKKCGYERVSSSLKIKKKTPYDKICEMFAKENLELVTTEEDYYAEANPILSFICPCSPDSIQTKTLSAFLQTPHCSKCYKKKERDVKKLEGYNEFVKICKDRGYEPLSSPSEYINVTTKLRYKCPKHGKNSISLSHLKEGKGCKLCGEEKIGESNKIPENVILERLKSKELVLLSEYTKIKDVHLFSCVHHPETVFKARLSDVIYNDVGCPACFESKGEKRIRLFLEGNKIKYEPQKKFDDLYRQCPAHKLSYDFYLPKYNLLIEYQGQFHDGTAWQQSDESYKDQQIKDQMKKEYAENHGFSFLDIWYWDYKNIEEILVKELNL